MKLTNANELGLPLLGDTPRRCNPVAGEGGALDFGGGGGTSMMGAVNIGSSDERTCCI